MKFIPQWRRAWRMASVQLAAGIVAWSVLPPEAQAAVVGLVGVPADKVPGVMAALLIVARLIDQPKARGEQ
jgi:hypothetical protein